MKKQKENNLRAGQDTPLLRGEIGEEKIIFEEPQSPRKPLSGIAAFLMGAVVVFLLFALLGSKGGSGGTLWERGISALGSVLLQQDFKDISGYVPDTSSGNDNEDKNGFLDVLFGFLHPSGSDKTDNRLPSGSDSTDTVGPQTPATVLTSKELYAFDYQKVGDGEIPIIPMDLSLSGYGSNYIHNATGYTPDVAALLKGDLKKTADFEFLSATGAPLVLIVHTHATESYSKDGAISYKETSGDFARTSDIEKNVVAVGKVLAEELNKAGIATVQCTVLHDQVQYKDSYRRAEESIRQYLEKYPTIRLVIDLHRDSVVKSTGELVRPVAVADGEAAAQIMCVVGSDWNGEACPGWQNNLALALKLREALNAKYENLCRPVSLKCSTYNQELAPYSLLLEMGASGNSLEEAKRSAKIIAAELVKLIPLL